jgi:hypothetical protein
MVSIDPDRRAFNGERACLGLYALTLEIFDAFHQGFDLRPRHADGVGTKGVPHSIEPASGGSNERPAKRLRRLRYSSVGKQGYTAEAYC